MTTPPSFPTLRGQTYSTHKKPTWNTLVAKAASGREVRAALYQYPLWEFELTFNGLSGAGAGGGLGASSLQALMGLYLQCQGQFNTFLFTDPTDKTVAAQAIGQGNASTLSFVMPRTLGGFAEPVGWVTSIANVYLNGGSPISPSGYSLTTPNSLVFTSAPGAGVAITADFSYAFQCRFLDDNLDFEQFMANLWLLDSLKFRSVRPN